MSRNKIIEDAENSIGEASFNENIADNNDCDHASKDTVKTRKRIDELLEKKPSQKFIEEAEELDNSYNSNKIKGREHDH